MADRFEDLRTFVAVIAAGGVNAAADRLGIARSAVSRRRSDLEARLGVVLVDRATRRFIPTATGLEYARRAEAILRSLDDLDLSVSSDDDRADVAIAASAHASAHLVVPALARCEPRLDDVDLRIVAHDASAAAAQADIVVTDAAVDGRTAQPLRDTVSILCASPALLAQRGVPGGAGELDRHGAIVVADALAFEWVLRDRRRRPGSVALVVPDVASALIAAENGFGLAQLPDYVVEDAIAGGRLVAVLPELQPPATTLRAFFDPDAGLAVKRVADALATVMRRR